MSQEPGIDVASSASASIRDLLAKHPRIGRVVAGESLGVNFQQDDWSREVRIGDTKTELYGLVEVIDNNPLVCADIVSVPGKAATLALIALAPLIRAGLVADSPVVILNFPADNEEVARALEREGLKTGVAVHSEPLDLGGVLAASVMVSIETPEDLDEIDFLYNEQFGRSFYVRRDETSEWGSEVVQNKPFAVYRIRISPDEPNSLLTIRLLSDPEGKCGAGQVIHALNIMCGFEETLAVG